MDTVPWGRIDDDGTVFVRTSAGERVIGSWLAGSAADGLAYYQRRYDGIAVEIDLLERRVSAADTDIGAADVTVQRLAGHLTSASAIGDLDALMRRLDAVKLHLERRHAERAIAKDQARIRSREVKEALITDAEKLAESTSWKTAGDTFRTLLDAWKAAPRLDKTTDDSLWQRFSVARSSFEKRRRAHFAELDAARQQSAVAKEAILVEAEALSHSTEWSATSRRYRELMTDWKAAGAAGRGIEDTLWNRFRTFQDAFFTARAAASAEKDTRLKDNAERKTALLAEAKALLPVTDQRQAAVALRRIHDRWDATGPVPREERDRLDAELRTVEENIRSVEERRWSRAAPAAVALAETTVGKLRDSISALEADVERARAQGNQDKASAAETAAETRRSWLVEAERTLAELSGTAEH
jgi:hypothetical protein